MGGPGGVGNFASGDGTLSSQSDYQQMSDGCGWSYMLRFGIPETDSDRWILVDANQTHFPATVQVGKIPEKDQPFQPCTDCQGRVVRVVDLGEAPAQATTASQHKLRMAGWSIALSKEIWDPALLESASYRDFVVAPSGQVDLSGQALFPNHLYYFLLSQEAQTPVTVPSSLSSEELAAWAECSKKSSASEAPFSAVGLVHALDKAPFDIDPQDFPVGNSSGGSELSIFTEAIQNIGPKVRAVPVNP